MNLMPDFLLGESVEIPKIIIIKIAASICIVPTICEVLC